MKEKPRDFTKPEGQIGKEGSEAARAKVKPLLERQSK